MSIVVEGTAVTEQASHVAELADVAGKVEIVGCIAVLVELDGQVAREHF